ncbi:unnamed protein product [Cuscuta europaea]|uniref:Myb/SANT-like domain-containing protein n=1 Tax=Cuscuta europaea TaxID=41803 RepID=A0A9P0YUP5_CUSEU|nr:unnamed protein product [Cuscuta europaea]
MESNATTSSESVKTTIKKYTMDREIWTAEMDNELVNSFLHQHNEGNRVSGTFTTKAYMSITSDLQNKFGRPFKKDKVKGRWKLLKRNFTKCYDLFKNLSGFAWDPISKRWLAEPEVWKTLVEAHPDAEEWMRKPIANYDKMVIICGEDRAYGGMSETGEDIRNDKSFGADSIETSDSLQEGVNDVDVTSPQIRVRDEPKSKRPKKSKDNVEDGGVTAALMTIAEAFKDSTSALRESTLAYEKSHQKLPISEVELWKLLEDLHIENHLINRAYLYLLNNPDMIKGLIGCPKNKQKELLIEMVFGPPASTTRPY